MRDLPAKALCVSLALLALAAPAGAAAERSPRVTIAWLPGETTPAELAEAGLAPGLMSAGLGTVDPAQTYLDVSQGNRAFDSLYDADLPAADGCSAEFWAAADERAASVPAEIFPGLLAELVIAAGKPVEVAPGAPCFLGSPASGGGRGEGGLEVVSATTAELPGLLAAARPDDLVIAIGRPPPPEDGFLAVGVGGEGEGNLTSDSTRTDGYVLATDVAPTVLERLGLEVPGAISGRPIRVAGAPDAAAVEALGARMAVIGGRRGPVIGIALLGWALALAALRLAASGGALRRGVAVIAVALVYLPLVLLLAAALEPGQGLERLLALLAPPALALATLALAPGYRALGLASLLTVAAYAVDVVAGSPLSALSLLGPNPGLGVRFYGIGNELEALLAVLVVAGAGAFISGFGIPAAARDRAWAFLACGLLAAAAFAPGRFGADVGAAIVLPFGAAVAAALLSGRRAILPLLAVPAAALGPLALADLLSGGDAHFTRSVLDAGGLGELGDVAQRRLELSAHSFARPIVFISMPLVILFAVLAVVRRDRIAAWTEGRPAVRAGLLGALAAVLVGALANDSGALLLVVGAAYLLAFVGFAWAEGGPRVRPRGGSGRSSTL